MAGLGLVRCNLAGIRLSLLQSIRLYSQALLWKYTHPAAAEPQRGLSASTDLARRSGPSQKHTACPTGLQQPAQRTLISLVFLKRLGLCITVRVQTLKTIVTDHSSSQKSQKSCQPLWSNMKELMRLQVETFMLYNHKQVVQNC